MTGTLVLTDAGLFCPPGGFHIDPWQPVERALVTHAHGDHTRPGHGAYLAAVDALPLLRARLPADTSITTLRYAETLRLGDVDVSFHPAGHVLGSAQIRIEHRGHVTTVSGDYKLASDPTCAPFEPVRCDAFVTESTFGLPIYRWEPPQTTIAAIADWWRGNQQEAHTSVLFAYALGKAQRVLRELACHDALIGPIGCHGAVERINAAYRVGGVPMPATMRVGDAPAGTDWSRALIVAPPSARGTRWLDRFPSRRTAFASGWMAVRGARRRAGLDRGFALSDHADWPALNAAIAATGADEIWVTHGYRDELVRWLGEHPCRPGMRAVAVETRFEGEEGAATTETEGDDGRDPHPIEVPRMPKSDL
jgi:putative mRNA 3-end processing factor